MKTKFNFKIDAMTVTIDGKQITTPQVDIQTDVETSIAELRDLYELKKVILKESPALIEEFMKKFVALQKTAEETIQGEKAVNKSEEEEEHEQIQHESLDKWFRDLYFGPDTTKDLIEKFYIFCDKEKVSYANSVKMYGLNAFFSFTLEEKIAFSNHLIDYLTSNK